MMLQHALRLLENQRKKSHPPPPPLFPEPCFARTPQVQGRVTSASIEPVLCAQSFEAPGVKGAGFIPTSGQPAGDQPGGGENASLLLAPVPSLATPHLVSLPTHVPVMTHVLDHSTGQLHAPRGHETLHRYHEV